MSHKHTPSEVPRESRACASSVRPAPMCLDAHCCPPSLLCYTWLSGPHVASAFWSQPSLPPLSLFSSSLFLPLSSASLLAQPGLQPSLGLSLVGFGPGQSELPGATVKDWNVGRVGVGWGSGEPWGAERGVFSWLVRVQPPHWSAGHRAMPS